MPVYAFKYEQSKKRIDDFAGGRKELHKWKQIGVIVVERDTPEEAIEAFMKWNREDCKYEYSEILNDKRKFYYAFWNVEIEIEEVETDGSRDNPTE